MAFLEQEKAWERELRGAMQPPAEPTPQPDDVPVPQEQTLRSEEEEAAARRFEMRIQRIRERRQEHEDEGGAGGKGGIAEGVETVKKVRTLMKYFDIVEAFSVVGSPDVWLRWNLRFILGNILKGMLRFPFDSYLVPLEQKYVIVLGIVNGVALVVVVFALLMLLLFVKPCLFAEVVGMQRLQWMQSIISFSCKVTQKVPGL